MKRLFLPMLLAALACLCAVACNNDSGTDPAGADDTTPTAKVTEALTSECYGFGTTKRTEGGQPETLNWSYDPTTNTLVLHHAALILNCCGVHTVDASYENGIVTVHENDQPEPEGGRCHCVCPFDFKVTLEGIPEQILGVRIELTVDETTTDHWAGTIDLAEKQGSVAIASSAPRVVDTRTSECNGFGVEKAADGEQSESLIWSYEPATKTLELLHAALILNCCGVHAVDATCENGVVTIYENDQPEPEGGRCDCICPFDFKVTLDGVPEQVLGVRIELTVDETATEHWAGAIDLTESGGTVTIATASF